MPEEEDLRSLHKALLNLNKRAERTTDEILVRNFVDSEPLFDLLSTTNNQVIYGRRGTGKTHALKYLADSIKSDDQRSVYIDLRNIGSNTSIYSDNSRTLSDRASTLIVDVLNALYDEFYGLAVNGIENAPDPNQLTLRLDDLAKAISSVRITGNLEEEKEASQVATAGKKLEGKLIAARSPSLDAALSKVTKSEERGALRTKRSGTQFVYLDFGNITTCVEGLIQVLGSPRIWLLMDEWSEVPVDLQPYLADLIRRTVLPLRAGTHKRDSVLSRILIQGLRREIVDGWGLFLAERQSVCSA